MYRKESWPLRMQLGYVGNENNIGVGLSYIYVCVCVCALIYIK